MVEGYVGKEFCGHITVRWYSLGFLARETVFLQLQFAMALH